MDKVIELKNITYSYFGKIPALKNISLEIKSGEMFCIIGQNGSGKSTLLNIMNALVYPDSGEVFLKGDQITEKTIHNKDLNLKLRKSMAFVFQNSDVQLFCPTVLDELLFAPLQLNMSVEEARQRADETLSYLNIDYLKDRAVHMLSGGEKKKVAIASVLTMNPEILLVDEPLSGLDPKTQSFFLELLTELHRAGKTIIFTTHQLDLIDHLQPRVAVLSEDHSIEKIGTAEDILNDEKFLISVNLIHEHIHKHGEEAHKHYHSHYVFHKH
ncbi:MAG: ABC transporter ATP-binding protein [Bacteroidota bacterium]